MKAQPEVATNSLRVRFTGPEAEDAPVSVASAYEELAPFGEIARLEVPPHLQSTAVVSYYDVRAAARALAALGDRCEQEPQYGERTLQLSGDVQLSTWMISEILAVRRDEQDGTYSLDFFDTRAAERASKFLNSGTTPANGKPKEMSDGIDAEGGTEDVWPRYRNDLRLSQLNWQELASGRETRTTLRLRCLPMKLCHERTFHGMLARAGLSKVVDCVRIFPGEGKCPGSALVNAVDSAGVIAVAKYFHGRQWGRSMPVTVSFAAVQGVEEVQRACTGLASGARCS